MLGFVGVLLSAFLWSIPSYAKAWLLESYSQTYIRVHRGDEVKLEAKLTSHARSIEWQLEGVAVCRGETCIVNTSGLDLGVHDILLKAVGPEGTDLINYRLEVERGPPGELKKVISPPKLLAPIGIKSVRRDTYVAKAYGKEGSITKGAILTPLSESFLPIDFDEIIQTDPYGIVFFGQKEGEWHVIGHRTIVELKAGEKRKIFLTVGAMRSRSLVEGQSTDWQVDVGQGLLTVLPRLNADFIVMHRRGRNDTDSDETYVQVLRGVISILSQGEERTLTLGQTLYLKSRKMNLATSETPGWAREKLSEVMPSYQSFRQYQAFDEGFHLPHESSTRADIVSDPVKTLESLLSSPAEDYNWYFNLAKCYRILGLTTLARENLEEARSFNAKSADPYLEEGYSYRDEGKWNLAYRAFREAHQIEKSEESTYWLAYSAEKRGKIREALDVYDDLIWLNEDSKKSAEAREQHANLSASRVFFGQAEVGVGGGAIDSGTKKPRDLGLTYSKERAGIRILKLNGHYLALRDGLTDINLIGSIQHQSYFPSSLERLSVTRPKLEGEIYNSLRKDRYIAVFVGSNVASEIYGGQRNADIYSGFLGIKFGEFILKFQSSLNFDLINDQAPIVDFLYYNPDPFLNESGRSFRYMIQYKPFTQGGWYADFSLWYDDFKYQVIEAKNSSFKAVAFEGDFKYEMSKKINIKSRMLGHQKKGFEFGFSPEYRYTHRLRQGFEFSGERRRSSGYRVVTGITYDF